jgi:hypothetical protein
LLKFDYEKLTENDLVTIEHILYYHLIKTICQNRDKKEDL